MTTIIKGAEVFFAMGFLALAVFMIWVAKPSAPAYEPKFGFLRSETGQVLYTVTILCVFAAGLAIAFHGLTS